MLFRLPLRLTSSVVRGFGRGSRDLGIPTANLSRNEIGEDIFSSLSPGIYWGFAGLKGLVYDAAISVGYNPTFNTDGKNELTIEPHLVASRGSENRTKSICGETLFDDFYGETLRLSICGFIRPELPYEGVEKLIEAIKSDIVFTEEKCGEGSEVGKVEKLWCGGHEE